MHQRLIRLGLDIQANQLEIATLLAEVHQYKYWRRRFPTFESYVNEIIAISLRTAQELLRVIRKCEALKVPMSVMAKVGWSKLAVVVNHATSENVSTVIAQAEAMSYAELKKEYSPSRESDAGPQDQPYRNRARKQPPSKIKITQVIEDALYLACMHTLQVTPQDNLEFMATHFLKHCFTTLASSDHRATQLK